jgi:hypothetical protein
MPPFNRKSSRILSIGFLACEPRLIQRTKVDPKMVNPRQDISLISPRPVFLIYGEAESDYGKNQFEAAYNPKDLWIVPAGTHGTNL